MQMRRIGLYTFWCSLLQSLAGCAEFGSNTDTKFDWLATESAPQHYPMEIIQGTFIYHGENEQGLYVPSGGTISSGWGHGISNHIVGEKLKPLPDRLKIIYFSYAEKQFYKGEFDLPYEKILTLFREGMEKDSRHPDYTKIMVGVAPGGTVVVWVAGQKQEEVFFGQAKKVDINPNVGFALPFKDKAEADAYIAKQLMNTLKPAELESLKKDGVPLGLWARYRNKYIWLPTFTVGHSPNELDVSYLNGEFVTDWDPADKKELKNPRPVPKKASFMTEQALYTITFDEFETMAAFEKLGANGKKVMIEFDPRMPRTDIRIRMYNDKESIELKKFVSKK